MTPTESLHELCTAEQIDLPAIATALAQGADPNATLWSPHFSYSDHLTPLLVLMPRRTPGPTPELLQLFVEHGADPLWASPRAGFTALHLAAASNHTALVEALLDLGADVNTPCKRPELSSPLVACIRRGPSPATATFALLLERGADANAAGSNGMTAIFHAIQARSDVFLERLLAVGAELNRSYPGSIFGDTALSCAVDYWPECIPRLVAAGADPKVPRGGGVSILWRPVFEGKLAFVDQLLALGADIDLVDETGQTVLSRYASTVRQCDPEVVAHLLERGANLHHADQAGNTPLHKAVMAREVKLVRQLMEQGADPTTPNAEGLSAQALAGSPLISAAVGQPKPTQPTAVTALALAFLRDGLPFQHGDWQLICECGVIEERGFSHGRSRRRVSPVQVQEYLGTILLEQSEALSALEAFLNQGLHFAGQPPLAAGQARRTFLEEEAALCARLGLTLQPEHAGQLVAEALAAGLTLSHGDKEGWNRLSAQPDGSFLYEAGSHFGPEGQAHDLLDKASLVARWARRFTLQRGRLDGFAWTDLDKCLEHLKQPTMRCWLQRKIQPSAQAKTSTPEE